MWKKIFSYAVIALFLSATSASALGGTSGSGTGTSQTGGGSALTAGTPDLIINSGVISTTEVINAQTGTSYTILSTDMGKTVTTNNASAVAVTLPQAGMTGFGAYTSFSLINIGVGTVTVTPTTSTINGSASLALTTNQSAYIISNGTNYVAFLGAGSGGGTVTLGTSAAATNPQRSGEAGTGLYSSLTNQTAMAAGGVAVQEWTTVSSAVDYLSLAPSASGSPGILNFTAKGSDPDVSIAFTSKTGSPEGTHGSGFIFTNAGDLKDTIKLQNTSPNGFTDVNLYDDGGTLQAQFAVGGTTSGLNNVYLQQFGNKPILFYTNGNERARILGTGGVAIGTTSLVASSLLSVSGGISQTTATTCTTGVTTNAAGLFNGCLASDRTLKKNIETLPYDAAIILKLHPVAYEWINKDRDDKIHEGFIAQEVEKIIPEAVVPAGKGLKGVDPNAMIARLTLEVQSLRTRLDADEKKMSKH